MKLAEIKEAASKADGSVREFDATKVNTCTRQGDVYLVAVEKGQKFQLEFDDVDIDVEADHDGKLLGDGDNVQVAVGQNVGARHIMTGAVKVYAPKTDSPLVGPLCYVEKEGLLTHPEHADVKVTGPAWVQVTFQRDYMADQIARVID